MRTGAGRGAGVFGTQRQGGTGRGDAARLSTRTDFAGSHGREGSRCARCLGIVTAGRLEPDVNPRTVSRVQQTCEPSRGESRRSGGKPHGRNTIEPAGRRLAEHLFGGGEWTREGRAVEGRTCDEPQERQGVHRDLRHERDSLKASRGHEACAGRSRPAARHGRDPEESAERRSSGGEQERPTTCNRGARNRLDLRVRVHRPSGRVRAEATPGGAPTCLATGTAASGRQSRGKVDVMSGALVASAMPRVAQSSEGAVPSGLPALNPRVFGLGGSSCCMSSRRQGLQARAQLCKSAASV